MRRFFIFAFVVAFLFVSPGLNFDAVGYANECALNPTATPKPKELARIQWIEFDKKEVLIGCPPSSRIARADDPRSCSYYGKDQLVAVKTLVSNPKNVPLTYHYAVSGGRINGEGANVSWDLSGIRPGEYSITVTIKGKTGVSDETRTRSITLRECGHCFECECPTLSVNGKTHVRAIESVVFTAEASGGTDGDFTYKWTVSQGEIVKGQGTSRIKVRTAPEMTGEIRATVEIAGGNLCPECPRTAFLAASIIK